MRKALNMNVLATIFIILLSVQPGICFSKVSPWKTIATQDLEEIKRAIGENHPGIVDDKNPYFKKWFEKGSQEALKSAENTSTFEEYSILIQKFINGFKDAHLYFYLTVEQKTVNWPGFLVAFRGNKFLVHSVSDKSSFKVLPKKNDVLVSCNEKPAASLMKENVFPYFGNEDLPADWTKFAPNLLLDFNNPYLQMPKTCEFLNAGRVTLSWQTIKNAKMNDPLASAAFGAPQEFSFREVKPGIHWISIPTFDSNGGHVVALKFYIDKVADLKQSNAIVFDVRGNKGGSSEWGAQFIEKLYGKEVLSFVENSQTKDEYVEYRVSPGNMNHFEKILPRLNEQYGKESRFAKYFTEVVEGIKTEMKAGKPMFKSAHDEHDNKQKPKSMPNTDVSAKIFLLTDGHCVSACLGFADRLLAIPGVVHIGSPTSAETNYMEVRDIDLPSGIGILSLATKVYRNRPRGHNQFYSPKHMWDGDMNDTPALEKWLIGLVK